VIDSGVPMGVLYEGWNSDLVVSLIRATRIRAFVETGTYRGDGTAWAARHFDRVVTIELRADFYAAAVQRFANCPSVQCLHGDSTDLLPALVSALDEPAIFWLDAHAGGGHFGPADRCPLLAEIDAITASPQLHCVLIDDARAFVAPPPAPFDYRAWPTLDEVVTRLAPRYVLIANDCLIAVPRTLRPLVADLVAIVRPTI